MSDSVNIVLQEGFIVTDIDKEGKKFDKVSRLTCFCEPKAMEVTLDYASELISFRRSEKISICLARSLQSDPISSLSDGAKEGKREMWRGGEQGLAEEFDYVMYGKIYKFDDSRKGDNQTTAYLSFGGLLMAIRGNYRHMSNLVINENIYLLVKK